ncbi:hypothetical protein ABOM_009664 [Aspergillus bombycis]|uniref:Uncharacterized protein n=1 Tax=Aspergillus bombycis TaxID=109264 RepID=A0A1F7ZRB1_9EURO|nr:hypothetical protein ABOM_009664 [Aspergillus bombycis]OGM41819.1 hypothetical protein ABOM_009664 [Aspergillus bombycis]
MDVRGGDGQHIRIIVLYLLDTTSEMGWFPTQLDSEESKWHFDILILLAVIGSSATQKHMPSITASAFGLFPRLLPAPETLLDTRRLYRLPSAANVDVVGVHSGTVLTELNYFATLVHKIEDLEPFEFRSCKIEHNLGHDREKGESNKPIRVKTMSLLNVITIVSIFMSVGLLVFAGVIHDGVALVGVSTMALSTSAASLSAHWSPKLSERDQNAKMPPADVVIRTRGGAFIVVRGDEYVIRELYKGMDSCQYEYPDKVRQVFLALSTLLLMTSVIMFSNSSEKIQIAVGAAYFILNILYWGLALLVEPGDVWDMSRYDIQHDMPQKKGNYTEVLWLAILETRSIDWVRRANIAPKTAPWDEWLREALQNALSGNTTWPAVARKDSIIGVHPREPSHQDANGVPSQV